MNKSIEFDLSFMQSISICFNRSFKLVYTVHRISAHAFSVDTHHIINSSVSLMFPKIKRAQQQL
jgi:hypothetical protein